MFLAALPFVLIPLVSAAVEIAYFGEVSPNNFAIFPVMIVIMAAAPGLYVAAGITAVIWYGIGILECLVARSLSPQRFPMMIACFFLVTLVTAVGIPLYLHARLYEKLFWNGYTLEDCEEVAEDDRESCRMAAKLALIREQSPEVTPDFCNAVDNGGDRSYCWQELARVQGTDTRFCDPAKNDEYAWRGCIQGLVDKFRDPSLCDLMKDEYRSDEDCKFNLQIDMQQKTEISD